MNDIFFTTQKNGAKLNFFNRLLNLFFYLSILLFFIGFNFTDSQPFGWYQQFIPDLSGKQITDMTFIDSLTGYAVARQQLDSSYVLKTTNGGDNWIIIYRSFLAMEKIQFLNVNIGYTCGAYLFKTTNGGVNWNQVNAPPISPENMYVLNENTIWIISSESLTGGVFCTTNGGISWTQQFAGGNQNPNKIYMYNARIGFIVNNNNGSGLRKTTNGGVNWFTVAPNEGFKDMYFADSLTGWRANDYVKKTTDGGLTWVQQVLPQAISGHTIVWGIRSLSKISRDTIWGSYPSVIFQNLHYRGILYRTTNGGTNWYYQLPDTSINIPAYSYTNFVNNKTGWAYNIVTSGIHTVTGGDTTFLSSARQISSEVPKDYILFQNYPNPFNPVSNIRYQVLKNSNVKIVLYNISGKEIATLINEKKSPGIYEAIFDARLPNGQGNNLSSGVYFYTLIVNDKVIDTKKAVLIK